jgi:hypothetical protein
VTPAGMRWIPGGRFRVGADRSYPEEGPAHEVTIGSFWIDEFAVTNADFAEFVAATGYVTAPERPLDPAAFPGIGPEQLVPGGAVFFMPADRVNMGDIRSRWAYVPGANWRNPEGPKSTIDGHRLHSAGYCAVVTLSVVKLGKLRAISSEALLYSVQQVLIAERLGQEFDRSPLYRLDGHWDIALSGDENDRNPNVCRRELSLKMETAFAGQPDIEN